MVKNLFRDLGFSPEEAAALKLKADLHSKVVKSAARYSQRQLQTILDESQPRVSDLLLGKDVEVQSGDVSHLRREARASHGDQDEGSVTEK
jgi:predicted XRE-type DNA-binding protein